MKRLLFIVILIMSVNCYGVDYRQLADPKQQESYDTLTKELRCLVCQNQTIADSNAELAADLRRQVYEMLEKGKSRDEIIQFMTDRYGDFVSYIPPFRASTYVLWLGPPCLFLIGFFVFFLKIRLNKANKNQAVEVFDEKKLDQLINKVKD